jgi:mannose-6-phosphate isomerase-like protein (cupin superfamily)
MRSIKMLIPNNSISPHRVDDALLITQLFDGTDFAFNVAKADLNGVHPAVVNRVSDRAYYFLQGNATVTVDDQQHLAHSGDLIVIHVGQVHALQGTATYLIITAPPFDPANEQVVSGK